MIPCAGGTAWSALEGMSIGQTVLIQGMCFPGLRLGSTLTIVRLCMKEAGSL